MKRSTQIKRSVPTASLQSQNGRQGRSFHQVENDSTNPRNERQARDWEFIRPTHTAQYENKNTPLFEEEEDSSHANHSDEQNEFEFLKDNPSIRSLAERRKQFMMKGNKQNELINEHKTPTNRIKPEKIVKNLPSTSSSSDLEEEDYEESEIEIELIEKSPIKTIEKLADGENMNSLHEKLSSIIMDSDYDLSGSDYDEPTIPRPKRINRPALKQSPQKKKPVLANRQPIIPQKRILQNQQIMQNQTPFVHVTNPDVSLLIKKPVNRLSKTPYNSHIVEKPRIEEEQDENTLILGLSSDEGENEIFEDLFDSDEF